MVYIVPGTESGPVWVQDPLPGMSRKEITELGIAQIQNGISSIDEVRDRLDLPPWGTPESSGPVVFTQEGPVPLSVVCGKADRAAEMESRYDRLTLDMQQ